MRLPAEREDADLVPNHLGRQAFCYWLEAQRVNDSDSRLLRVITSALVVSSPLLNVFPCRTTSAVGCCV